MQMLPTTNFLGKEITRMIVGDNPQTGHSYIEDIIPGADMKAFYTPEKILETLFVIQDAGYNAILPLSTPTNLEIIFQPYTAIPLAEMLPQMMELEPFGIYHQGTTTDFLMETGDMDTLFKNIELIRSCGVKLGLGTHVPETVLQAEKENWGIDFYMLCMYNARRNRKGEPSGFITGKTKAHLVFQPQDRFDAYKVIKEVQKPFIAYKILAGGQIFAGHPAEEYPAIAENIIRETYENIKPGDITCVGVFQRDSDQARANADTVRKIFG